MRCDCLTSTNYPRYQIFRDLCEYNLLEGTKCLIFMFCILGDINKKIILTFYLLCCNVFFHQLFFFFFDKSEVIASFIKSENTSLAIQNTFFVMEWKHNEMLKKGIAVTEPSQATQSLNSGRARTSLSQLLL